MLKPICKERLDTCHNDLQRLVDGLVDDGYDVTVIEGHRTQEKQDEYFRTGKSKLKWPDGKHCATPSNAVDIMENPIDWNDRKRIEDFAKVVLSKAQALGLKIRWGGDWNQNGKSDDEKFFDGPHFERA